MDKLELGRVMSFSHALYCTHQLLLISLGTLRSHEIYRLHQPYSKTKAPEGGLGFLGTVYSQLLGCVGSH